MMLYLVKEKHALVLQTYELDKYIGAVPHSAPLWHDNVPYVQMPHTDEAMAQLARAGVGVNVPSPFRTYYTAPKIKGFYAPRPDQIDVAEFICRERKCFVLNPPRMGKTYSTLMAFDYLRRRGSKKGRALCIAPLPTVSEVWLPEVYTTFNGMTAQAVVGSKKKRLDILKEHWDLFVINPDGVKVIQKELLDMARAGEFRMLIIDEITEYGNPSTQRWKSLNPIAREIDRQNGYIVGLTGTPGGPEQVFGQVKMVKPDGVPSSMNAWRQETMFPINIRVAKTGRMQVVQKWKPRADSDDKIRKALQPSIRFEKSVLGLAQLLEVSRLSKMSAQQEEVFKRLRLDMKIGLESGAEITAANAAVMFGKLLQVTLGVVYDDDGKPHRLDCKPRLDSLDEEIAKSESKVVIFCPFRSAMGILEDHLKDTVRVDGSVTGNKRLEEFARWRDPDGPQTLILHPRTGAYGLELALADTLIMYGPPLSAEFIYSQMKERINSPMQKSLTPTIVELSASDMEVERFRDLKMNVAHNDSVIKYMSKILKE